MGVLQVAALMSFFNRIILKLQDPLNSLIYRAVRLYILSAVLQENS